MENFEERLILAVRENDVLYNKSKTGYKNTHLKAEVWRKIATDLGTSDEICMKRWKGLRDRFVRETRKLSAPSGSAYSEHSIWELYESLKFLKDHMLPRNTRGTHRSESMGATSSVVMELNDTTTSSADIFYPETSSSQSQMASTPKPKRKKVESGTTEELTQTFQSAVEAFKKACDTDTTASFMQTYMKSMALKLEKLPTVLQNSAVLEITEYVIKLENLQMDQTEELPRLT